MNTIPNWISAFASLIGASGVFLLWWQVRILKKQAQQDHERSRRERSIDILFRWNEFERTDGHLAIAIAERIDKDSAIALWSGKEFNLPERYKATLERFILRRAPTGSLNIKDKYVVITEERSIELRSGMVECMNLIETILTASRHNTADSSIIREQFAGLIDPDPKLHKTLMRTLREVAGGIQTYPSMTSFYRQIMLEKQPGTEGKPEIA